MLDLQRCLCVTCLMLHETAAVPARSVYTVQPGTMSRHFMQSHVRRVHTCLAVTCTFGRMTGIYYVLLRYQVGEWNGYRSKSQHRKLTLDNNKNLPQVRPGLEPATFRLRVRRSTTELFPLPIRNVTHRALDSRDTTTVRNRVLPDVFPCATQLPSLLLV